LSTWNEVPTNEDVVLVQTWSHQQRQGRKEERSEGKGTVRRKEGKCQTERELTTEAEARNGVLLVEIDTRSNPENRAR